MNGYKNTPGLLNFSQARVLSSTMFNNFAKFYPRWEMISSLISPNRFSTQAYSHNQGMKSHKRIVKTEPTLAWQIFKSGLTNGTTPKNRKWYQYTSPFPTARKDKKAQDYLASATEISETVLQLSNFYRVMPEANGDLGLFSNAAFMMLPDPKYGVYFYPFQQGTYAFQANLRGDVNMFTRRLTMTVNDYVKEYGSLKETGHINWANIPPYIKQKYDSALYNELVYMCHLIIENPFYNPTKPIFHNYQKKFQEYYWIDYLDASVPPQISNGFRNEMSSGSTAANDKGFNDFSAVRGYNYFPVITPRWAVPAGHSVGCEGPGDVALNSMLVYQSLEKDRLLAIEKILKPPMVGPASLRRHGASILPGGITYVEDSVAQTAVFKPAFLVDPKIAELIMDSSHFEQTIDDSFYKNIFLMFANQDLKSHVSVAETNERSAEKLSVLSPMLAQYDVDVGSKLHTNLIMMGEEMGWMPPRPQILQGADIQVDYMSILANAAKSSMMGSLERASSYAVQMAGATQNPLLLRILKSEEIVKAYAEYAGVDPRFMASPQELQQYAEMLAAKQAQESEMAQAMQQSEVAKNLSAAQPAERGSMLSNLNAASTF